MLFRILGALLLTLACVGPLSAEPVDLVFIDHFNLRKVYQFDQQSLAAQVAEIKANLQSAKAYNVGTYILFSRSFESLINYDFAVNGLGDLSGVVFPTDSEHRRQQAAYAKCLNEVIDYADSLGVRVIFHSNQFDFPESLYKLAGDKLSGSAQVCPGKPLAFDLLSAKIREFFAKCPKCAGLQLTLSETQARVMDCRCPSCEKISEEDRFVMVARTLEDACRPLGKTIMIRTWGRFEKSGIVKRLPESVICSTKFTLPDFHLTNYPNPVMGLNAARQEVEFDGWGEYSGYNLFPAYYGDLFVDRIKTCQKLGVSSMGIRLNWEPGVSHIFSKPYGNECNIVVFAGLARDPSADPDKLLRDYVARVYPQSAREAAFRLYKRSTELQRVWLTWRGENCNDHSRIYWGGVNRVRSQIGRAVPDGYDAACRALDERRVLIDDAYAEARQLVEDLGPDVATEWRRDLLRGARTQWYMAQANCDCIQMYAAFRETEAKRPMPSTAELGAGLRRRMALWKSADPEMYELMLGVRALEMLDQMPK